MGNGGVDHAFIAQSDGLRSSVPDYCNHAIPASRFCTVGKSKIRDFLDSLGGHIHHCHHGPLKSNPRHFCVARGSNREVCICQNCMPAVTKPECFSGYIVITHSTTSRCVDERRH